MTEAKRLKDQILERFPAFTDLPYYAALDARKMTYEQTMKAHLQDLARSVGCRGLREIQLDCLGAAVADGSVDPDAAQDLAEVINDELPRDSGPPSHFQVRVQMFEGLGHPIRSLEGVRSRDETAQATESFRTIFLSKDLLAMTAAVGAIEHWYVPVAERLEVLYLELGYSASQVATYNLHKAADVNHSLTALGFVERHARPSDFDRILTAVDTGFLSVRLYDDGRYAAAYDDRLEFADYLIGT